LGRAQAHGYWYFFCVLQRLTIHTRNAAR
jgi:hypothetical protein